MIIFCCIFIDYTITDDNKIMCNFFFLCPPKIRHLRKALHSQPWETLTNDNFVNIEAFSNIMLEGGMSHLKPRMANWPKFLRHTGHRSYDTFKYPLIFSRGEDGYHYLLQHTDSKDKLSAMNKCTDLWSGWMTSTDCIIFKGYWVSS